MNFIKNKKTIIIAAAVVFVAAWVIFIIVLTSGARSIKVSEFDGTVEFTREEEKQEVYKGLKLKSEDEVKVAREAALELLIDDDKHVQAKENTEFKVVATGSKKKGAVKIELVSGDALITIDKKLNKKSTFEVETPNATMAVRGTTFDVNYEKGDSITTMSVTDGVVHVEDSNGDSIDVAAGESVMVSDEGIIETSDKLGKALDGLFAKENLMYAGKYFVDWDEDNLKEIYDTEEGLSIIEDEYELYEAYRFSGEAGYTDWSLDVWGDGQSYTDEDYDYISYEQTRFLSTEDYLEYEYYVDYPDPVCKMGLFETLEESGVSGVDSFIDYLDIRDLVVKGEKSVYMVPGYGRVTLDYLSSGNQFLINVNDTTPGGLNSIFVDDKVNSDTLKYRLIVYRY